MSFNDIVNQEIAKKVLKSAIKENKVHHSYLFFGPEGCGKKDTALEFIKVLNCLDKKNDEACDSCSSCKKSIKNVHPDVMWVSASGAKQVIGINAIRQLEHFTQLKSLEVKYKIALIERPEKLTKEAGNCFLKTLEEPPRNVIIILLTAFPDKILPTIVSRCQKIKFLALNPKEGIEILKKKFNLEENQAHMLYFVCSGKTKWIQLWIEAALWNLRDEIFDVFINIFSKEKRDYTAPLKLADSMMEMVSNFTDKVKKEKQDSINEFKENLSSSQIKNIKAFKQAETEELKKELIKIIFSVIKSFYADIFSISCETGFIINLDKEISLKRKTVNFSHSYLNNAIKEIENSNTLLDLGANLQLIFQVLCINLFCGEK
ncbi:MAG: DNA polymerase III subunit delta' [Candidatus Omnitrophica bacterium]|nr:DNA polymerase III subunit delta' [Candidatus Omnitrophota bacterium]MBU1047698.1 DNA polymerase III subunit delta' [Candidatus Omnitrophota bacterium]MBU1766804.1 DNA polymerase III subunit delta' [Candidatus Omnitrophota bacterium]MBU1888572.1 DNA polymerase III subunit delta' [Candidatus Omnitrophota bacterium]